MMPSQLLMLMKMALLHLMNSREFLMIMDSLLLLLISIVLLADMIKIKMEKSAMENSLMK